MILLNYGNMCLIFNISSFELLAIDITVSKRATSGITPSVSPIFEGSKTFDSLKSNIPSSFITRSFTSLATAKTIDLSK